MKRFFLTGMKYSVYSTMNICGHVKDRCCTIVDEITIQKLWNLRTEPLMAAYQDRSMIQIGNIIKLFQKIAKIDPREMQNKYLRTRTVPYFYEFCNKRQIPFNKTYNLIFQSRLQRLQFQHITKSFKNGKSMKQILNTLKNGIKIQNEFKQKQIKHQLLQKENKYHLNTQEDELNELKRQFNLTKQQYELTKQEVHRRQYRVEEPKINFKQKDMIHNNTYSINNKKELSKRAHSKTSDKYQYKKFELDKEVILGHQLQTCRRQLRFLKKDFIVINQQKANFCYKIQYKLLEFDNYKFMGYLQQVKAGLQQMVIYRSNIYCLLCDMHQQKRFNVKLKKYEFSYGFCQNLLIKNKAHLKFLNIVLVQYLDFLFTYINCYDSRPDNYVLKAISFLTKYKQRIPLIQKCFDQLESDLFFQECWFLCQSFKWDKMTQFYDGNMNLFQQASFALQSFYRRIKLIQKGQKKMKKKIKFYTKRQTQNLATVNGILVEPLNPSHSITLSYAFDRTTYRQIMGHFNFFNILDSSQISTLNNFLKRRMVSGRFNFVRKLIILRQILIRILMLHKKRYNYFRRKIPDKAKQAYVPKQYRFLLGQESELNKHSITKIVKKMNMPIQQQNQFLKNTIKVFQVSQQLRGILKKEINKAEEEKQQEKPFERNLKVKSTLKERLFKKSKGRVEQGKEIYSANRSVINLKEFKDEWQSAGMDLTYFTEFIDYKYDTNKLITKLFKKQDEIHNEVITSYLLVQNKDINKFNHTLDEYLIPHMSMLVDNHEYYSEMNKAKQEPNLRKKKMIVKGAKSIVAKLRKKYDDIQENKKLKKLDNYFKQLKYKEKMKGPVINHHIDQKHYTNTFNGNFRHIFEKIFGT